MVPFLNAPIRCAQPLSPRYPALPCPALLLRSHFYLTPKEEIDMIKPGTFSPPPTSPCTVRVGSCEGGIGMPGSSAASHPTSPCTVRAGSCWGERSWG